MEVELQFSLVIDGSTPIIHQRKLEDGAPSDEFCADVQNLRCTLSHLMQNSINEGCR